MPTISPKSHVNTLVMLGYLALPDVVSTANLRLDVRRWQPPAVLPLKTQPVPTPAYRRKLMPTSKNLTCLELIDRSAVRALAFAVVTHIDIHLGVVVPKLHIRLGAGAVNTALLVQVFGSQFDDGSGRHGGCLSRRWKQPVHASCINENLGPASGASRSSCRF